MRKFIIRLIINAVALYVALGGGWAGPAAP